MEIESKASTVRRGTTWPVTVLKLSSIILLILLANSGVSWVIDRLEVQFWPEHLEIVDRVVLVGMILYICLMATPFLPGVEIGLVLMVMLGPKGVLLIYVGTLIALTISFGLGRLFPMDLLASLLRWLHLTRAETLLRNFATVPPAQHLEFLVERASSRTLTALLKRRYLTLALLLNLPGNALIGGGGGIAMMAGMCRLYSFPKYLLLLSIAILPGPVLLMLSKFM